MKGKFTKFRIQLFLDARQKKAFRNLIFQAHDFREKIIQELRGQQEKFSKIQSPEAMMDFLIGVPYGDFSDVTLKYIIRDAYRIFSRERNGEKVAHQKFLTMEISRDQVSFSPDGQILILPYLGNVKHRNNAKLNKHRSLMRISIGQSGSIHYFQFFSD